MRPGITRPFNVEGHLFPQGLEIARLTVLLREKPCPAMQHITLHRTAIRDLQADNLKEDLPSLSSMQGRRSRRTEDLFSKGRPFRTDPFSIKLLKRNRQ
jgi:hypothetical protein